MISSPPIMMGNFRQNISMKKIISKSHACNLSRALKSRRKKIVFTNGTFDILHAGHVQYLEKAREYGDVLIIGVNSDKSVQSYKGPHRPINHEKDRLRVLSSLVQSVSVKFMEIKRFRKLCLL